MGKSVISALDGLISDIPGIVTRSHESTGPMPSIHQAQGDEASSAKSGASVARDRGTKDQGTLTIPTSAVSKKSSYGFDKFAEDSAAGEGHNSQEEK